MPTHDEQCRWIRANLRVLIVHFLMDIVLIAVVLAFMPGFRTNLSSSLASIALAAVVHGLLSVFAKPALDALLMPFVVQTYGFAIVLVDALIFALLAFLVNSLTAASPWQIVVGGTALLRELEYAIEAYSARRLSRILEPIEEIVVPDVAHELSPSGVLTSEFTHGDMVMLDTGMVGETTFR